MVREPGSKSRDRMREVKARADAGDINALAMLYPPERVYAGERRARVLGGQEGVLNFRRAWRARQDAIQERKARLGPSTPEELFDSIQWQRKERSRRMVTAADPDRFKIDLLLNADLDRDNRDRVRHFFGTVEGWPQE